MGEDDAYYFPETYKCIRDSGQAILVECLEDGTKFWVPKSQVHDNSECYSKDTDGTLVTTEWWANKEGYC